MKHRAIVVFSIFMLVALVVVIFIYFYRVEVDKLLAQYVDKITSCANITDEQQCFKNNFCEGIYGPSCPDCNDREFKSCKEISKTTVGTLIKERQLCEETGGNWYENRLGSFCLCDPAGVNKVFSRVRGCVSR